MTYAQEGSGQILVESEKDAELLAVAGINNDRRIRTVFKQGSNHQSRAQNFVPARQRPSS